MKCNRNLIPRLPMSQWRKGVSTLSLTVALALTGWVLAVAKPAAAQFPEVAGSPYLGPPALSQRAANWKNDSLGWSNYQYTIGSAGCAITALAMMMSWYGVPTTPRDMNEWLRTANGYNYADVKWNVAAGRAQNVQYLGATNWYSRAADLNVVNNEIDGGYVCILEVRISGKTHFVLGVGRLADSSNYWIIDSLTGNRTALCPLFGKTPGLAIYGIRKYHITDVGQGAVWAGWHTRVFIDAFYRGGGRSAFQTKANDVHWWGDCELQDFVSNGQGSRALVDGGQGVYPVNGLIGGIWFGSGGVNSPVRRPRSDEFYADPSPYGARGRIQIFENGAIVYSPQYGTYSISGRFWAEFDRRGRTGGQYGFPKNAPWAWNGGMRQDFEGGYIWFP